MVLYKLVKRRSGVNKKVFEGSRMNGVLVSCLSGESRRFPARLRSKLAAGHLSEPSRAEPSRSYPDLASALASSASCEAAEFDLVGEKDTYEWSVLGWGQKKKSQTNCASRDAK